ncbi:MAG: hypothetical protein WDN00_15085 [Limisphaerales bacterium]
MTSPIPPNCIRQSPFLYPNFGLGATVMTAVSGDYAYVANGQDGLEILSITNPANPVVVGPV